MADIELRSFQNIVGLMLTQLLAATDLTDLSDGSVYRTIVEASASSDFSQEAKLIQLLNLRNIDKATGVDLENLAFELGLSPKRTGASSATVSLTITDSAFTKVASNIYAGSTAPTAGDTRVRVVNGLGFTPSGTLYLGRGTQTSESISYISLVNTGSYTEFTLSSPLTKDHLVGEEVVLSQGGERRVDAEKQVLVPAFSGSPAIKFEIQKEYILADGEDTIINVSAVATDPGALSNVSRHKISQFSDQPWTTARVTNDNPAVGGRDTETDAELRQRVKDHVHELGRGTERAIVRAVTGASDPEENKRIVSAFLRKPTDPTKPAILFIDDGTGFAPSFSGIGQEIIANSAVGTENFFQLQKWPLVKCQVASIGAEPFALQGGESLSVEVDGTIEERVIPSSFYRTPGVVLAQEVAEALNKTFTSIEARAKDGQLFITPIADEPDYIRIGTASSANDANASIRFPIRKQYTIRLYKNDVLLDKSGREAVIQSLPSSHWTGITSSESLQLTVDGIDSPLLTLTNLDFANLSSSTTIAGAGITDWVKVINAKFIGIQASARDDGTFIIKSNRGKVSAASVAIKAGTVATKIFPANSSSTGKESDYKVNRLLGQIQLSSRLSQGDQLKAGSVNTRGFTQTSASPTFSLAATNSLPAQMVLIADAPYTPVIFSQQGALTFATYPNSVQRITASQIGQFASVQENDVVHLYNLTRNGLFRVVHISTGTSFPDYIDVSDPNPANGTSTLDGGLTNSLVIFRTLGLPQVVNFPIGTAVSISDIVSAIQTQLIGISATLLDTGAIAIATQRYSGDAALGIPSVCGSASTLGIIAQNYLSNDPHVAAIESGELTGLPTKRIVPSSNDNVSPYVNLSANQNPFTAPIDSNRAILSYLGANEQTMRQPAIRLDTSHETLRGDSPVTSVGIGPDMRGAMLTGVELGQADNMVFLLDNSPQTKTFDVPMYTEWTVASPGLPSTLQFDLSDSAGNLLGISSRWAGHRFEDHRVWLQARGDLNYTAPNSSLRIQAVPFGPNGERVSAQIVYPSIPSLPAQASLFVDAPNDQILISLTLASDTERTISLQPNRPVTIGISGSLPSTMKVSFLSPVDLTQVQIGDILSINDANASPTNQGQYRIGTVNSFLDNANSYQFKTDPVTVDVNGATAVTLDTQPANTVRVGDLVNIGSVQRTITAVSSSTSITVAAPGFTDGSNQSATIAHSALSLFSAPGFTPLPGDKVQCGNAILTVTQVYTATELAVDQPFAFTGLRSGTLSRIQLICARASTGSNETVSTASSSGFTVFALPASKNKAKDLIKVINGTAGVLDVVSASFAPGNADGSGPIVMSTADSLMTGASSAPLLNGESFVYSTSASSPGLRLKEPLAQTPVVGDKVRLIPSTPRNIFDHLSRKQITGLSIASEIALVDGGRRVQISSKVPGGLGQVYAVGGRASGLNVLDLRSNAQEISSSRALIELDKSSADLLAPGHTIRISQSGRAKKRFPVAAPTATDTLQIDIQNTGVGLLTLSTPLVNLYPYSQTSGARWAVRKLGKGRVRYEALSNCQVPSSVKVDDWVLIGNGSLYAGITTDKTFAPANQGWFQVREADGLNYFDVDNLGALDEFVSTSGTSLIFTAYHSVLPGDQIVLGAQSPISTNNKGTYIVTAVPTTTTINYLNPHIESQPQVAFGASGVGSVSVLDQGYSTYRKVVMVAPKPSDPTNRALVTVTPGTDMSLLSEGQLAKITLPARLGFVTDPVPGVSAYQFWTGLKRRAQRLVDGYEPDSASFPGVGAAGVSIEVREPQIERVSVSLKIKTSKGVSAQSLTDTIKSAIAGYINQLGLGSDVIMSEIIALVQEVPGVEACTLVSPIPGTERITVTDSSIARINASDITLS